MRKCLKAGPLMFEIQIAACTKNSTLPREKITHSPQSICFIAARVKMQIQSCHFTAQNSLITPTFPGDEDQNPSQRIYKAWLWTGLQPSSPHIFICSLVFLSLFGFLLSIIKQFPRGRNRILKGFHMEITKTITCSTPCMMWFWNFRWPQLPVSDIPVYWETNQWWFDFILFCFALNNPLSFSESETSLRFFRKRRSRK